MAPCIISLDEMHFAAPIPAVSHCYYLWLFGYVVKLPYERQLPVYNSQGQQMSGPTTKNIRVEIEPGANRNDG